MLIKPGMPIFNALNPPLDNGEIVKGTIGGVVYESGRMLLLTCFHCVKNPGLNYDRFVANDKDINVMTSQFGAECLIGKIIAAKRDDKVDIAIIEPLAGIDIDVKIPTIGFVSGSVVFKPNHIGKPVVKFGLRTDKTTGYISNITPSVGCDYPPGLGKHFLNDLMTFSGANGFFAQEGDSGSFVLNDRHEVVGIIVMVDGNIAYGISPTFIELSFGVTFKK